MRQFWTLFFVFAISLNSSGVSSYFGECHSDEVISLTAVDSSSEQTDQNSSSSAQEHHQDCSCSIHATGCCHIVGIYIRSHSLFVSITSLRRLFFEYELSIKQGPTLDGPFQPPRSES